MKKNTQLFHRVARQTFLWWTERQQWLIDHPEQTEVPNPTRPPVILICQRGCLENNFAKQLSYQLRYNLLEHPVLRYVADHLLLRCEWVEPLNESTRNELKQWLLEQQQKVNEQTNQIPDLHYQEAIKTAMLHGSVVLRDYAALALLNGQAGLKVKIEASTTHRIKNLHDWENMSEDEAQSVIDENDQDHQKHLQALFGNTFNESELFDLIINLSEIDIENAIWKIIKAMRAKNYPVFPRKEKFLR